MRMDSKRARRAAAPLACLGVLAGFVACGGSEEHRQAPERKSAGGDSAEVAGAPPDGVAGSSTGGVSSTGGTGASAGAPDRGGSQGTGIPATPAGGNSGEAGAAGQSAGEVGGDGIGGAAGGAGGETIGGASGHGGESSGNDVDPVCGANRVQVGAVSEWCGKVNVHLVGQSWVTDPDCDSGCRNNDAERLAYCKKFYPTTTAIVTGLDQKASGTKDWKNKFCQESTPDGPGISGEFACCAAAP